MGDTQEDVIREMARNLQKRDAVRRRRMVERSALAREEVLRLTRCFRKKDPKLRRVVLFGSLAKCGLPAHYQSDIDVAVDSDRYLALVGEALRSVFDVDVVDLRTVREAIRNEIERYGEVIYER